MKANTIITTFLVASLCLVTGLIVGLCLDDFMASPALTEKPSKADPTPSVTRQASRNTKQVDLGNGIVLKESVLKSDNGEVTLRMTYLYRNGKIVMVIIWGKKAESESGQYLAKTYWHNDGPILHDGDDDGDGFFELLLLSDESGPLQVFDQTKDGRLIPVGKARLKKMQDICRFMSETFKPIAEGAQQGVPKQEIRKRIEDAIEKTEKKAKAERGQ